MALEDESNFSGVWHRATVVQTLDETAIFDWDHVVRKSRLDLGDLDLETTRGRPGTLERCPVRNFYLYQSACERKPDW
jgi:hypothetical protein